ncbi:MAG: hypothetical protein IKM31_07980 [Oscillospiraceae bacterium]|nr:hypothetical protein [Oscillospiraceae bacterium]
MAEYTLTYDYGKGEVPTTFEEFAAYVNRPVYEVQAAYARVNNLGLVAMGFRGEDLEQAALMKFAGLFAPEPLRKAGFGIEECLTAYAVCCREARDMIRQFRLPEGAERLLLPRHALWMFTLFFCRKDGPFYTEAEWERLLTFGEPDGEGVLALNGEKIAEADALVRDRKLSPSQASELLIRIMKCRKN